MKRSGLAASLVGCAVAMLAAGAQAQGSATDEIAKYRQMLQDGNPAELLIVRGEELWKQKRGPKNVSLEQCDLGLGAGVVKGAYAQLPRFFADANQVMDFEARLVHCMVTLQGFDRAAVTKSPFSGAGQRADRHRVDHHVRGRAVARRAGEDLPEPPDGACGLRARPAALLHARRTVRLLVRHLPRRRRPADPAAGPAQHLAQQAGRRARLHDVAGVPRVAGRAAHDAVAPERLLPAAAVSPSRSSSRPPRST